MDSEAVKREQQEAIDRVTAAVIAAQEVLAGGSLETAKRKAGLSTSIKPAKRARIYGFEDFSESDSDVDSEDEAAARLTKAGQIAATASSGNDSDVSAQETALAVAAAEPDAAVASPSGSRAPAAASAETSAKLPSASSSEAKVAINPQLGHALLRSPAVTDADAPAAKAASEAAQMESSAPTGNAEVPAAVTAAPTAKQDSGHQRSSDMPAADNGPISLAEYQTAAELEAVGLGRLKHDLTRHGLKCGGSLQERAARLFLLKTTPVDKLDQKHFSKPSRK